MRVRTVEQDVEIIQKKIEHPEIKGEHFDTKYLTYRQLRDYLNKIWDDEVLDCPVICIEHHHFTHVKCNPVIEIQIDIERESCNAEEIEEYEYGKLHLPKQGEPGYSEDYCLQHPKQPNLSLTI